MHGMPAKDAPRAFSRPGLLPPSRPQSMPQTPPDARPSPSRALPMMHFGEFWLEFEIRFLSQAPDSIRRAERSLIDAAQGLLQEPKLKQAEHLPHHAAISRPPRPHTSLPSRAHRACASAQPRASSRLPHLPPPSCLPTLPKLSRTYRHAIQSRIFLAIAKANR